MIGRLVSSFLLIAALCVSLSGCIVGDSIAHVVKLAVGTDGERKADSAGAAPEVQPPPPAAHDEAPPPAAAPPRSSVSVETLAPPSP